jgi:hypothetical protein
MRHFLSPAIPHLAQGVRPPSPSAALVSAAGLALPRSASALRALPPAVARALDIALWRKGSRRGGDRRRGAWKSSSGRS